MGKRPTTWKQPFARMLCLGAWVTLLGSCAEKPTAEDAGSAKLTGSGKPSGDSEGVPGYLRNPEAIAVSADGDYILIRGPEDSVRATDAGDPSRVKLSLYQSSSRDFEGLRLTSEGAATDVPVQVGGRIQDRLRVEQNGAFEYRMRRSDINALILSTHPLAPSDRIEVATTSQEPTAAILRSLLVSYFESLTIDLLREAAQVRAVHVFYNNSAYDGFTADFSAADADAIAPDKVPLNPGETATFRNYTSFSQGLNGVVLDVEFLRAIPSPDDLVLQVGNVGSPLDWPRAEWPTITRIKLANGMDRLALIWRDGSIVNQWLRVALQANARTGLLAPKVFAFGNAVAETGDSTEHTLVNNVDLDAFALALGNPNLPPVLPIDDPFDFNRDGSLGISDLQILTREKTESENTERGLLPLIILE